MSLNPHKQKLQAMGVAATPSRRLIGLPDPNKYPNWRKEHGGMYAGKRTAMGGMYAGKRRKGGFWGELGASALGSILPMAVGAIGKLFKKKKPASSGEGRKKFAMGGKRQKVCGKGVKRLTMKTGDKKIKKMLEKTPGALNALKAPRSMPAMSQRSTNGGSGRKKASMTKRPAMGGAVVTPGPLA